MKLGHKLLFTLIMLTALQALQAQEVLPPEQFSAAPPATGENIDIAIRWVANEYLSPESEKVDRNYLTFESFDEVAGEDVRVELWGMPASRDNIWIFVHDRTANNWWAYGGANSEGEGLWVIHGVRFGEGAHQGQRFTIRAAVLNTPPEGRILDGEKWIRDALAVSDPVYVTIQRRLIRPYPPSGQVAAPQIWLSTIDHQTVSTTEAMVTPATAGIAGTFEFPENDGNGRIPAGGQPEHYIYVLIRSTAADRWRVFGPAVVNGVKWEIRDVDISDPGEPQWVKFKITAVISRKPLSAENLDYEDWWLQKIVASDPVEVAVKPHTPNIDRPFPEIGIRFLQTLSDTQSVFLNQPLTLDSLGSIIQVGGRVANIPQGASVWLLINPIGTPLWEVHGKALVTPPRWELPLIHSSRLKLLNVRKYRLLAMVSTTTLQPGLIDYDAWRMNALSISEGVVINESSQAREFSSRFALDIETVGGVDVSGQQVSANLLRNSGVAGSVNRLPQGTFVWAGTRLAGAGEWQFSGPAFINDDHWHIPQTAFAHLDLPGQQDQAQVYDVVAITTRGPLPVNTLKAEQLHWYALGTSPVVRLAHNEGFSFQFSNLGGSPMLFLILLILAILGMLEYYFRSVSEVTLILAEAFEQLSDYLQRQFADLPKPEIIPSSFGIIILVLGIFAIAGYFPIYTHVLEEVLHLSPDKSESLALLLIIFIGLAGVITHLSIEYVSMREGSFLNRIFDYFLNYALPITVLLVTFCLWGVQALLYLELYMRQVEPGNIRIPAAMGAAAFFIAGIETLGFYWATRLGKEFFGWLIFNLFIFAPPAILGKFFRVAHTFFQGLHHRGQNEEAAPARKHTLPDRSAESAATE